MASNIEQHTQSEVGVRRRRLGDDNACLQQDAVAPNASPHNATKNGEAAHQKEMVRRRKHKRGIAGAFSAVPTQLWSAIFFVFVGLVISITLVLGNRQIYNIEYWKATEIRPGLWLGSYKDHLNLKKLQEHHITHVLTVAMGVDPIYPDNFDYLVLHAYDFPDQDLLSFFAVTNRFIQAARVDGAILVHCMAGVSRSATLLTAYLMEMENLPLYEALTDIRDRRPKIRPNKGFLRQLEILSRLDRNTTHVDIPKLAVHWPRKARISQWKQDGSVSHFRLPGDTPTMWDEWKDYFVHHFLSFFNRYLRFYFKKKT